MALESTSGTATAPSVAPQSKDERSVAEARDLIERAYKAFLEFRNFSQEQVDRIVDAIAAAATAKTGARRHFPLRPGAFRARDS